MFILIKRELKKDIVYSNEGESFKEDKECIATIFVIHVLSKALGGGIPLSSHAISHVMLLCLWIFLYN